MIFLPYLLFMLFLGACAFSHEFTNDVEKKKRVAYMAMGVFFIFFVFRGYLYTDWANYYEYFEKVEWSDIYDWQFDEKEVYEPGFALLALVCRSIVPEYLFLQAVVAAISILLLFRFIRRMKVDNVSLCLLLFFTFSGLGMIFNLLRNSIAILLFLNALEYISQRKMLKYYALCLLAISFHFSSVIYLPLYFIFHWRMNRWVFLACFIVFAMMYLSGTSVVMMLLQMMGVGEALEKSVELYTETYTVARSGFSIGFLERAGTAILITIYYGKLRALRPQNAVLLNGLLVYFFFFFCFADFATFSKRLSIPFSFAYWILWGDLLRCFYHESNRNLFFGFMIFFCVFKMHGINQPVQQYDNLLLGIETYEKRMTVLNATFDVDDN